MLLNPPIEKEDPRITRTRSLILDAFLELLSENGFQSLTVQAIADRAGINRATFYAHFSDKYSLLDFSIREAFRQEIEKRTLNACHYSNENLRVLILVVCEFVSTAHTQCASTDAQFDSLVETQVKAQLQMILQKWLEDVGTEVEPKIAATAATWALYGLVTQWCHDKSKGKPSAGEFVTQIFPLIAANLTIVQTLNSGMGRERAL